MRLTTTKIDNVTDCGIVSASAAYGIGFLTSIVYSFCSLFGIGSDMLSEKIENAFRYRTTHNDGVFHVYTDTMRAMRKTGILTGLPDAYGRGRIIGDYRRLALYGINRLIEAKKEDLRNLTGTMTRSRITLREEVAEQIKALQEIKVMGSYYGLDLSLMLCDSLCECRAKVLRTNLIKWGNAILCCPLLQKRVALGKESVATTR